MDDFNAISSYMNVYIQAHTATTFSSSAYIECTKERQHLHQNILYTFTIICPNNTISFSIIKYKNKGRKCRTQSRISRLWLSTISTHTHTKTSLKPQKHKLHLNFPKYITESYYPFLFYICICAYISFSLSVCVGI